ncbi:hypothetical protein RSAG8_08248, partial [Rhizoctonia solani AG-8 WAC10335]
MAKPILLRGDHCEFFGIKTLTAH